MIAALAVLLLFGLYEHRAYCLEISGMLFTING